MSRRPASALRDTIALRYGYDNDALALRKHERYTDGHKYNVISHLMTFYRGIAGYGV
jgi:hypothetical protein